jgi:hypothetical protein
MNNANTPISLLAAVNAVRPQSYAYNDRNIDSMKQALKHINTHKSRWLQGANILFVLGSITLGILIVVIIWSV